MTHAGSFWFLLVDSLAVFRLTVLVVKDSITAPVRAWLVGRVPATVPSGGLAMVKRPKLAEFLGCPWCVSPSLALGMLAAQEWLPYANWVITVLALSAVAGLLSEHV
jgi:Protein of unknown function (DUF1360)